MRKTSAEETGLSSPLVGSVSLPRSLEKVGGGVKEGGRVIAGIDSGEGYDWEDDDVRMCGGYHVCIGNFIASCGEERVEATSGGVVCPC